MVTPKSRINENLTLKIHEINVNVKIISLILTNNQLSITGYQKQSSKDA